MMQYFKRISPTKTDRLGWSIFKIDTVTGDMYIVRRNGILAGKELKFANPPVNIPRRAITCRQYSRRRYNLRKRVVAKQLRTAIAYTLQSRTIYLHELHVKEEV